MNTPFYGWGLAGRIETTALAVQALGAARLGDFESLAGQGLLFLLRSKDRFGVWHSTQAMVNALDALLILAAKANASESSGPAYILVNGQSVVSINAAGPVVQDI